MHFIDEVKIHVTSGNGGKGCVSFRRERFVAMGGPNGGDGGHGGSVFFEVDSNLGTLLDLRYRTHYNAKNGVHGRGSNMHGKNGEPLIIRVPPGTIIYDSETGEQIADLTRNDDSIELIKGGMGGRGNARFATSTNRAPRYAQPGQPGGERWLRLELKLLADVGLVALPNAGKSTLISAISAAKPKIADYPFTTLTPNLGVVRYGGYKTFVMADIPGLIEGASDGQGLGTRFLKHVERNRLILHLVDASTLQSGDPIENFHLINAELEKHNPESAGKKQIVVLTKQDLTDVREQRDDLERQFREMGHDVFAISSATHDGLEPLVYAIGAELDRLKNEEEDTEPA